MASATERFLHNRLAPELLSFEGRIVVLTIYFVMLIAAVYGCTKVEIDFSVEYFIGEDSYIYDYYQLNDKYFQSGFPTTIFVDDPSIDYTSIETQLQFLEFEDKLLRCYGCREQWFKENTLTSWYGRLNQWVNSGECTAQRGGIKPFIKYIEPDAFYPCLWEYLDTDLGTLREKDIIFTEGEENDRLIKAFKIGISVKQIDSVASQGVEFLQDIRVIENDYGLNSTYSYASDYLDFE